MAENNTSSTTRKKRKYYPPKNKVVEKNSSETKKDYEFSSYNSSEKCAASKFWFGTNILDFYTEAQLKNVIKDPIAHNDILRELSLKLYSSNGIFTNTVDYMTAMPTLDKVIVTHGTNPKKKRANKEKMNSILSMIKDKEIIRDALFKGMIEGVAFYYFETTARPLSTQKFLGDYDVDRIVEINEADGINASIISLPVDYTKIVGIKNNSYVLAFNLDYFDDCTGESQEKKLRKYPEEIRNAYRTKNKLSKNNWYVLDNTKTIVHKIRSKRDEKWGRPLVLAAVSDILYGDYFTDTKRNVLDEINNRIIYQTFPEGKDKGSSALTKTQQKAQHDAVKSAVMNKNNRGKISFFSVAAGTKLDKIDPSSTDIFDEKYESDIDEKIATKLGFAASLLSGSGSGSYSSQENNIDLVSSQIFQWVEQIQAELNKCISENVIKDYRNWVECYYLPITFINRIKMVGYMKDLYMTAGGSMSAYIAATGFSPDAYFALLDEELESGIYDKYKPHQTSYTYTGEDTTSDDKGGRPVNEDSTNPNTMRNRTNGSNDTPSPSRTN